MQQARDFFKQATPDPVASYYFKVKNNPAICDKAAACHMRIKIYFPYDTNPDIEVFATNAKGTTPEEKRYLDWVMSRTESPWRKMFTEDDFEILYNDQGQQVGVLFPKSFLKRNKYLHIMGFVTALRLASEMTNHVPVWDDLVQKHSVHPVEALILCGYFSRNSAHDSLNFSVVNTNHHILNLISDSINVQKIKDGDLNWDSKNIFELMPRGDTSLSSFLEKVRYGHKSQTGVLKGSVVSFWPVEEVLKIWRSVYAE